MMVQKLSGKQIYGSLGIASTQNSTHFPKVKFVVAGGGFYSYYIAKVINQIKKGKL